MNRSSMFIPITTALAGLCLTLSATSAVTQEAADVKGVKAASQAFYAALSVLDDGEAMGKVWAHTPYITFLGPGAKSILVGWDAFNKAWAGGNKLFATRSASMVEDSMHLNGNVAWEAVLETGQLKFKTGEVVKGDYLATNVFEKQSDGRWLMVSHHANPKPQ